MAKISKKNRLLFIVFMFISFLQMSQYWLTPGIAKINTEVFPELPLSTIQTAMTLPSLLAMIMSIVSASLIGKRLLTKKASVIVGISLMSVTGVAVLVAHYAFWHLCVLSVLMGSGLGFFVAPALSIVFDNFSPEEVRLAVGLQSSAINFGGIVMSIVGGVLASLVWYGGYFTLLLGIPVVILCILTIPNVKKTAVAAETAPAGSRHQKTKLPPDIVYFSVIMFVYSLIFPVCGTNISSHLMAAGIGNTTTAGIATAAQMAGGVIAGVIFSRLSAKLRDFLIPMAFMMVFIGLSLLNLGRNFLLADIAGVFLTGASISIFVPQVLFSTSSQVDASNSATALTVVNCVLPGLGGFLSPIVFTNLTTALGGPSTSFRYGFVAVVSLIIGIILVVTTLRRSRRETACAALIEQAD
jgi:MFS family permease